MYMETFGKRLKEVRKEKKYTQKEIANVISLQRPNYSKVENDHQKLNTEQLKKLCEFLDISSDYLLDIKRKEKTILIEDEKVEIYKALKKVQDIVMK